MIILCSLLFFISIVESSYTTGIYRVECTNRYSQPSSRQRVLVGHHISIRVMMVFSGSIPPHTTWKAQDYYAFSRLFQTEIDSRTQLKIYIKTRYLLLLVERSKLVSFPIERSKLISFPPTNTHQHPAIMISRFIPSQSRQISLSLMMSWVMLERAAINLKTILNNNAQKIAFVLLVFLFSCSKSYNFVQDMSKLAEMSKHKSMMSKKKPKDRSTCSYTVIDGVRTVKPYVHEFTTFAKVSNRPSL